MWKYTPKWSISDGHLVTLFSSMLKIELVGRSGKLKMASSGSKSAYYKITLYKEVTLFSENF